jgi:hypothetical protein
MVMHGGRINMRQMACATHIYAQECPFVGARRQRGQKYAPQYEATGVLWTGGRLFFFFMIGPI